MTARDLKQQFYDAPATFQKIHFSMDRDSFNTGRVCYALDPNLTIEETIPIWGRFYPMLKRVGGPWGWDKRPKYLQEKRDEIEARLAEPDTRLFYLNADGQTVGYCLVTAYRHDLRHAFNSASHNLSRDQICEIENVGLFPEHTGKGYGRTFLPLIFEELLKDHEIVYLSTRSTNHAGVVPFYQRLGMRVTDIENRLNDLVLV